MFVDSIVFKQKLYCSVLRTEVGEGGHNLIIFCGHHKCMTPNENAGTDEVNCNVDKIWFNQFVFDLYDEKWESLQMS